MNNRYKITLVSFNLGDQLVNNTAIGYDYDDFDEFLSKVSADDIFEIKWNTVDIFISTDQKGVAKFKLLYSGYKFFSNVKIDTYEDDAL